MVGAANHILAQQRLTKLADICMSIWRPSYWFFKINNSTWVSIYCFDYYRQSNICILCVVHEYIGVYLCTCYVEARAGHLASSFGPPSFSALTYGFFLNWKLTSWPGKPLTRVRARCQESGHCKSKLQWDDATPTGELRLKQDKNNQSNKQGTGCRDGGGIEGRRCSGEVLGPPKLKRKWPIHSSNLIYWVNTQEKLVPFWGARHVNYPNLVIAY